MLKSMNTTMGILPIRKTQHLTIMISLAIKRLFFWSMQIFVLLSKKMMTKNDDKNFYFWNFRLDNFSCSFFGFFLCVLSFQLLNKINKNKPFFISKTLYCRFGLYIRWLKVNASLISILMIQLVLNISEESFRSNTRNRLFFGQKSKQK